MSLTTHSAIWTPSLPSSAHSSALSLLWAVMVSRFVVCLPWTALESSSPNVTSLSAHLTAATACHTWENQRQVLIEVLLNIRPTTPRLLLLLSNRSHSPQRFPCICKEQASTLLMHQTSEDEDFCMRSFRSAKLSRQRIHIFVFCTLFVISLHSFPPEPIDLVFHFSSSLPPSLAFAQAMHLCSFWVAQS